MKYVLLTLTLVTMIGCTSVTETKEISNETGGTLDISDTENVTYTS